MRNALPFVLLLLLCACLPEGPRTVALEITPPNPAIASGTSLQMQATARLADGSTRDVTGLVDWSSSDAAVARFADPAAPGRLGTVGPGRTTLQARLRTDGTIGTVTLLVTNAVLVSLDLQPAAASVPLGVPQAFTATGTFSDGTTQDLTSAVRWGSASIAAPIATLGNAAGNHGIATPLAPGSMLVTATDPVSGVSALTAFTVTTGQLVSIAVTPGNPSVPLGLTRAFTATGTYTDGTTQDLTASVTWSSSAGNVAKVSNAGGSRGLASTLAPGSTTITATDPATGIAGSAPLTVTGVALVSIAVTPTAPSVPLGLTRAFTATGTYTNGTTQDLTTIVTWSSSSTAVASISNADGSRGLASTLAIGSTTITATDPATGIAGGTAFTVTAAQLVSIGVTPTAPSVPLGLTRAFTATGTYTNGTTQDLTTIVTWTSSSTAVASISNADGSRGLATSLAIGSTTITAMHPATGITGSTAFAVTAAQLVSISVTPASPSVPLGLTRAFTATGTYTNGTTQDLTTVVTWSSSSTAVASISNADGSRGVATTLAIGSTTITATDPATGIAGSTAFAVTAAQLVSIAVTPANPSVPLGLTRAFTATGTYTNGTTQDLTTAVTWSSSASTVATVSNADGSRGLATSLAIGSTMITATDPATGITGSTAFAVTAAQLVSISVTPASPSVPLGLTRAFTATGTYTNGTTQDLTTSVTWSSSTTTVASISNSGGSRGLASTLTPGSTTITATDPATGIAGSTGITVTAAQLVSIAVTPSNPSAPLGLTQAFTATGTYTNGTTQDLTNSVTWSSSSTAVATISNADGSRGLASTLAIGSTTITATDPATGIAGSTLLSVSAWTPAALGTNLALWLDAADPSTIIVATGVSQWRDRSGNARHFTQPTTANQPAYSASPFFGQPGVTFDGVNDVMNLAGVNSILANRTHGIYWVFRRVGNGSGPDVYRPVIGVRPLNGTSDFGALHYVKNGSFLGASYPYYLEGGGNFDYDLGSGTAYDNATGYVMAFQANAASGATAWQIHRNGSLEGTTNGIATPTASVDGYTLGAQMNPARFSNVTVTEVILVANTDQSTRQRVEGYLAHKWGLTANLPAGHPYRNTPP